MPPSDGVASDCGRYRRAAFDGQPDAGRYLQQRRRRSILAGVRKRWPWVKHIADRDQLKLMARAAYLDFCRAAG
ncbi:hypothetical protein MES5069_220135 [Mesorhizobium escarrei]|uniref:Uncharacterized protein n=1 Tax=Mesorhizobium escarrei TaxID=666018 RepID=A0ABM9DT98_9HYPH|nr:hypothetical protein MES5069_220135 [Mesorhizobium escarrei]